MIMSFGLLIAVGVMLAAWGMYLHTRNPGIVDVFWGINIFLISSFYLSFSDRSTAVTIAQCLLFAWAVRLSAFLWVTRIKKKHVDKRYKRLSQNWRNEKLGFLYNFLLQAFLAWLVSIAFYFIAHTNTITMYQYLGYLMVIIGITFESAADKTLYTFKPTYKHEVCAKGLWQYSRHPNYFFECLIWLGFSSMGFSGIQSVFSFTSVLVLFCIMWFVTIPLTEKESVKHRGDLYKTYQKKVSCFFPWFNQL
ncbi:MAG: DUF1295 domain-containing protein [Legionellaceae bacterium]|nr:DUF1295 domain-containing protein [Legionellaceae bacterium]